MGVQQTAERLEQYIVMYTLLDTTYCYRQLQLSCDVSWECFVMAVGVQHDVLIGVIGRAARAAAALAILQRACLLPPAHPSRHGVLVTVQLLRDVASRPADAVQRDDGCSLDERQLVDASRRTSEHRCRRRGRGGGRGGCSSVGRVAVLLVVTVSALAAMLVSCSLPLAADRALELQTGRMNRREQAQADRSTAVRVRGPSCAASGHIVLLSICMLTMLEALMSAGAERGRVASLQSQQQQRHRHSASQPAGHRA